MGSPYREARPKSPERLSVKRIDFAGHDPEDSRITVTVSFLYEPWCCHGSHEITDAISAVVDTFEAASDKAEAERLNNLNKEYEGIFDDPEDPEL